MSQAKGASMLGTIYFLWAAYGRTVLNMVEMTMAGVRFAPPYGVVGLYGEVEQRALGRMG